MRRIRWLVLLALTAAPLGLAGCDGILSACVYNRGQGPCEEWVPQHTCESSGGTYHSNTTCANLGMEVR